MRSRFTILLLLVAPVAAVWAVSTQISSGMPIVNFRLPTFTPEGYHSWLVRGSEARLAGPNRIEITELTLSIFTGRADDKVETLILSPSAVVHPSESVITGPDTIRVINDQFEASGSDWRYEHKLKKVSINQHVRVTFRAEVKDLLK